MKYKFYPKYIDKWDKVWKKISLFQVWNDEYGFGLWDKGKGLKPINQALSDVLEALKDNQ